MLLVTNCHADHLLSQYHVLLLILCGNYFDGTCMYVSMYVLLLLYCTLI